MLIPFAPITLQKRNETNCKLGFGAGKQCENMRNFAPKGKNHYASSLE